MTILSNTDAIRLALIPGYAEALHRSTEGLGNMAWSGFFIRIKNARNILYIGVALTAIASIGAAIATTVVAISVYAVVIIAAVGLSIFAARRLYVVTSHVQEILNTRNTRIAPPVRR